VVTNASVAGGANRVWIEHDERSYAAEILAVDTDANFALLRVSELPKTFRVLPLAPDESPVVGSFVVAVTAPLDLAPSPAFGMVSGHDRGFSDRRFPIRFVRISIQAHPGEGGSPVVDLSGRVVGMMIASIPEISSSYVLPVKAIQRLRDDVVFHGGVRPGWVGLDLEERPLPADGGRIGVFVQAVLPETPAAAAGLQAGDHIVTVDGAPARSMDEFRESSFYARIGQVIVLQVRRAGVQMDVAVTVGAKPPPRAVIEATERPSTPLDAPPRGRGK
jgi:S1-C subfamily serine protease